ncbi:organic cation transporter protein isoform X2 [Nematostella vectensis]|nr:organic cation transporter protein isoform X2 [Nematostella vectensis]XP_048583117.1 organic cation transporter protein isoform X2 [Nematostella vectensis]XP_048583118.1 organic cation transporter protein isoform X2 [Nematostella vectensis]XP_048583119.1 organic cation transporter protein isoform X2 [Nematostella vectensis]
MPTKQGPEYDDVFKEVPQFGRYQLCLYLGTTLLIIPMGLQFALLVFAAGTPKFHCADANSTCIPNKCCDNCTRYSFDGPFTSTVSEWDLICDRAHLGATSQAMFLVGMLVGSLLSGIMSDAFGRRLCMLISCFIMIVCSAASSFADCLSLFALLRFGVGFSVTGLMLTQYVYVLELVGPTKRTAAGKVTDFFWVIGACATCLLGYLIRDWRILLLVGSLPAVVFFFFWKVFPETARWLVAKGNLVDAQVILEKCADGRAVDSRSLQTLLQDIYEEQQRQEKTTRRYTPLDMIKTPKLRRRTIIVCFNWFVVSIIYFGFVLYITSLSGDVYINFLLMSIIDVFNTPISWFLLQKIGRRLTHCSIMLTGGLICVLVLVVPKEYTSVVTGIAIMGKFCDTAAFSTIYLYTSELYPTVIRNTAMGTASMFARIGGIIAPYIVMLAQLPSVSITLPIVIFGVCSLAAGVMSLWLPETLRTTMQQTIEETEMTPEDYGIPCCGCLGAWRTEDVIVNNDEEHETKM